MGPAFAHGESPCPAGVRLGSEATNSRRPPRFAEGFTVEYHENFKVVTVGSPWQGAVQSVQYLLLRCGAEDPGGWEGVSRISIPVRRMVSLSTSHLPHLELLDRLDTLVGIASVDQVTSTRVRKIFSGGAIQEVGRGSAVDLERLLVLEPDLVLTDAGPDSQFNSHPALERAGIPVVIASEYLEGSILGRTEWLLFTALFFDLEEEAAVLVSGIEEEYERYRQLADAIAPADRPSVFGGSIWGDLWHVAGGLSFPAQLFADAGGEYLWATELTRGSLPLDFEAVYERAREADFWLPARNTWKSKAQFLREDERYASFRAVREGQVYNFNGRVNDTGGNDYWERGLVEPHRVLADLIFIFHPQLLPNHELQYLRRLP